MKPNRTLSSEQGSALLIAIMILMALTVLGIASTNNAVIDLSIAANERDFVNEFYVADSGWKSAVDWLEGLAAPPHTVNATGDAVRNFGDGGSNDFNDDFPDAETDGELNGIDYWYNVTYLSDEVEPGSGGDYRRFHYQARSVADKTQEVQVRLSKVYKVGY
jgi:hypothetical protein